MIDLYAWPTPHGLTVTVMLEELGLPYNLKLVDITKPESQNHEYLRFAPMGRIPVIVEHDDSKSKKGTPTTVWEAGAICLYLAEKSNEFLPKTTQERAAVYQWLMFQNSTLGPTLGQAFYYRKMAKEKHQEAIDRFTNEAVRCLQSLELHFKDNQFLTGEYSIADITTYPWVKALDRLEFNIEKLENLCRWRDTISARPAVQKGMQIFKESAAA